MKQFPPEDSRIANREWEWLRGLGPEVCPAILTRMDSGYVMEELDPIRTDILDDLPASVLGLLREKVWTSSTTVWVPMDSNAESWQERVGEIFAIEVPDYVIHSALTQPSCSHGDPSFSNVMRHPREGTLRLIDPCHRDYAPQTWGVDAGKIVQSCLGWETLQAGWDPAEYNLPDDEVFRDDQLAVTLWWAGFHALRIYRRESGARRRQEVLDWADIVAQECFHALGV